MSMGTGVLACKSHSSLFQKCSVSLKSGLCAGLSSTSTTTLSNQDLYWHCFVHKGIVMVEHGLSLVEYSLYRHSKSLPVPVSENRKFSVKWININISTASTQGRQMDQMASQCGYFSHVQINSQMSSLISLTCPWTTLLSLRVSKQNISEWEWENRLLYSCPEHWCPPQGCVHNHWCDYEQWGVSIKGGG